MNLDEALHEIADASGPLAAETLRRLSALRPEQASLFAAVWHELPLQRRQALLDELNEMAEENADLDFAAVFSEALKDRDPDVRAKAVKGLWESEKRETFDGLVKLLVEDPAPVVRAEVALALGRFVVQAELGTLRPAEVERVEDVLQRVYEDEGEVAEVRGRALEALGARSEGWVSELIQEAYDGSDRRLRLSAVHAMGRSCDSGWVPTIVRELESEDAEMRFEAAVAAGMLEDGEAVPYLLPLLQDEDTEVQWAAIAALGEIGGTTATGALEELLAGGDERARELALEALAEAEFAEDPLSFSVRGEEPNAPSNGS